MDQETDMTADLQTANAALARKLDCLRRAVADDGEIAPAVLARYLTATGWTEGPTPFWQHPHHPRGLHFRSDSDAWRVRVAIKDLARTERRPVALLVADLLVADLLEASDASR